MQRVQSPWLAGLKLVNHSPDAVDFSALDHLQWGRTVESRIGSLQPGANRLFVDDLAQRFENAVQLS